VFLPATVDVAKRKKDVSPEVVEASELWNHIVALRRLLRLIKKVQRLGKALAHPQTVRQSKLRLTQRHIIWRRGDCQPVGCDRCSDISEIALQLALEAVKGVEVSVDPRDFQATVYQADCSIGTIGLTLNRGGSEIRPRRTIVLGSVEMLRVQRRVLVRKPLGGLKVQLAAAGSE
jgi:hypothetical protein